MEGSLAFSAFPREMLGLISLVSVSLAALRGECSASGPCSSTWAGSCTFFTLVLVFRGRRDTRPLAANLRRSQWWRFGNYWTVLCTAPEAADASYPSACHLCSAPALRLVLAEHLVNDTARKDQETSTSEKMSLVACRALWHLPDSGAGLLVDAGPRHLSGRGYFRVLVENDHHPVGVSGGSSTAGWRCP